MERNRLWVADIVVVKYIHHQGKHIRVAGEVVEEMHSVGAVTERTVVVAGGTATGCNQLVVGIVIGIDAVVGVMCIFAEIGMAGVEAGHSIAAVGRTVAAGATCCHRAVWVQTAVQMAVVRLRCKAAVATWYGNQNWVGQEEMDHAH